MLGKRAGGERLLEDAVAALARALALYPSIDVARARERVAELSVLAEAPEMLEAFDELLRRR